MVKGLILVFLSVLPPALARGQIKVATVTDATEPSSKAVIAELRSKISSHPKLFTLVSGKDPGRDLIVQVDCLVRKQETDAFVCFYTSHHFAGGLETFMGGGINAAPTSGQMADDFLASIAQDLKERWTMMVRRSAIEGLESCLALTQSSCKVPDTLVPELRTKVINLSQYFQQGGLTEK
jgi:hypothetical protein